MDKTYSTVIEALIFSSDEPISEGEIIRAIRGIDGEDIEITSSDIHSVVEELNSKYEASVNSFKIKKLQMDFYSRPQKKMQISWIFYHQKIQKKTKPGCFRNIGDHRLQTTNDQT